MIPWCHQDISFTASVLGATVLLQALEGEDDILVDDLEVPGGGVELEIRNWIPSEIEIIIHSHRIASDGRTWIR